MKIPDKVYHHLSAIAGFVIVALIYFYPVLQGKEIHQSDIVQFTGMAKEQNDFRASDNAEPYWTNSAFGGMPTYQLGAKYPHNYVKMLDSAIRFLPRPADYLFLYFAGFYVLLLVVGANPLKAFFGALAFGFSTYLIIILGVGHNAKAHAIGYMPLVVAGILLVYRKRFIAGGLLTMFAAALEINANHFQMTYYLLLFILIMSVYFVYRFVREKDYNGLIKAIGVFVIAGIFSVGANATNLMATAEYTKFSTRGKSELTIAPDGAKREGSTAMTRDYITEYSYGIAESFNLIAPRLFGGSNSENIGTQSEVYKWIINQGAPENQAREFSEALPTYWGDQPIVAAPAYIGAVVFFLAVLAMFVVRRRIKYVFLAGAVFSLMLSWGKNFPLLTDFFIDFVPMYDKFRAISSIQVILELCMPVLAIMGLHSFFKIDVREKQWKALWMSAATVLGIIILLFFFKSSFGFRGGSDSYFLQNYGPDFVDALIEDRKALYSADLLRSGFLIVLSAFILWLFVKGRLAHQRAVIIVGIIMIGDLYFVGKKYVDSESFVNSREVRQPFQPSEADMQIMADTTHYRVFEVEGNLNSARASYFHKSIGGYHAAKPRRVQELFDYQIARNSNLQVLNMLNVKYLIQSDENGRQIPVGNPEANGNAWFVSTLEKVSSADDEMNALTKLNTKRSAVYNASQDVKIPMHEFELDSTSSIRLVDYKPNHLKYVSENRYQGCAIFSEVYYENGWNAYIDGKLSPHFRADYTLRALIVPPGRHTIEFKFEPEVIRTGSSIALVSSVAMMLLLIGGIYFVRKRPVEANRQ